MTAVLGLGLVAAGCSDGGPIHVSLGQLVAQQEQYRGRQVQTRGIVRRFDDPTGPYYVIDDAAADRVEVLPAVMVAGYEGRDVAVRGRFDVSPTSGRFIATQHVAAVP